MSTSRCAHRDERAAAARHLQRDDHLARLGVLDDVGQRLLDEAVDRQLRRLADIDRLELVDDLDVAARGELAQQDLEGSDQAEVAER